MNLIDASNITDALRTELPIASDRYGNETRITELLNSLVVPGVQLDDTVTGAVDDLQHVLEQILDSDCSDTVCALALDAIHIHF